MNYNVAYTPEPELLFNSLTICPCYRSVFLHDVHIQMTTKEFDLLYFLARHPGWALTKDQIYAAVWGEDSLGNCHTVENTIYRLRQKIEDDTANPKFIQTIIGYGYRFLAT